MATQTMAIDSQVHAYERNGPERPWAGALVRTITAGELEERLRALEYRGAGKVSP